MNQFTGGSTPAQQDSAARTPDTRAVNALLALQKQLDTVQDRLSNEQKKSESRLDGLLQNMLVCLPDFSVCVCQYDQDEFGGCLVHGQEHRS